MTTSAQTAPPAVQKKSLCVKVLGVGNAGASVLRLLTQGGMPGVGFFAVNTDAEVVPPATGFERVSLETRLLRGLGTGGDPERGRAVAEEQLAKLKALCQGADVILLLAGLGGGAGTGISPVLARAAKESGALVLAFVTLPFACEGVRRQRLAQHGLDTLKAAADVASRSLF